MAGIFLDETRIKKSIQNWMNFVATSDTKWEGNNLHVDEIDGLKYINRSEWIIGSIAVLNIFNNHFDSIDSLVLFLHIDMKYSKEELSLGRLNLKWLMENIHEFTPPSLNFSSIDYYRQFYKKELVSCKPDINLSDLFNWPQDFEFFYRTYFDEGEEMYSREIYIFLKKD